MVAAIDSAVTAGMPPAAVVGFDARAAAGCYGRQAAPLLVTADDRARLFALLASDRGVTEMASTFDCRDVIQHVAQWAGDRLDAHQITDLADEWLATETVVTLDADRREGRTADVIRLTDGRVVGAVGALALYTTRQVLDIEQRLLAGFADGRHAGTAVVAEAVVEAVLGERPRLAEDQIEMVRAVTRSGHQLQCVLGPAGSGKTTAIEAAVRAWEAAGYGLFGDWKSRPGSSFFRSKVPDTWVLCESRTQTVVGIRRLASAAYCAMRNVTLSTASLTIHGELEATHSGIMGTNGEVSQ